MKNLLTQIAICCILLIVASCKSNKSTKEHVKNTIIHFQEDTIQLGKLYTNDSVVFYVKYTNVGTQPLFVYFAKGSCGCMVSAFNKESLQPNHADSISVNFKTPAEAGLQTKTFIVGANTDPSIQQVFILADITKKIPR